MSVVRFLSALIIESPNSARLVSFYRDVLGVPLEADEHEGSQPPHYECELGDVHFAIHPKSPLLGEASARSSTKVAFAVTNLDVLTAVLREGGADLSYAPVERGFARMTALKDPDGNVVELTELSARWLDYLESRPRQARDIVEYLAREGQG